MHDNWRVTGGVIRRIPLIFGAAPSLPNGHAAAPHEEQSGKWVRFEIQAFAWTK